MKLTRTKLIWQSWRRACAEHADHPRAAELFDRNTLPAFHDPFAGGGSLPLEAQRLGLEAHASDLNPVAVLISKAMIEIPPRFAGQPPVNPETRSEPTVVARTWKGAQGLADDVRHDGRWMRDEAKKRIGHLYPPVEITPEMVRERPDLQPYEGRKLTVIAWLWARTVKSPNPAFADVDVPLASTFMLSTKKGKEAYVEPVIRSGFAITGTWPMRTELGNRMIGMGTNALASSVVLVCRRRSADVPSATHREFRTAVKFELPPALRLLQTGNIAPVDLAQAAIGPGMAVYTRYAKVQEGPGARLPSAAPRSVGPPARRVHGTRTVRGLRLQRRRACSYEVPQRTFPHPTVDRRRLTELDNRSPRRRAAPKSSTGRSGACLGGLAQTQKAGWRAAGGGVAATGETLSERAVA